MRLISGADSTKRESFIQLGKHRKRVANDHHALLIQVSEALPYSRMEDVYDYSSFIGCSVLLMFNMIPLISVRNRAEVKR